MNLIYKGLEIKICVRPLLSIPAEVIRAKVILINRRNEASAEEKHCSLAVHVGTQKGVKHELSTRRDND